MRRIEREVDVCVVGGGYAGMCAAVAAARRGAKVCLLHDRPVWGGNGGSEIRVWIAGARGRNRKETGLIEELLLDNLARNPTPSYAIWDEVQHSFVLGAPNLEFVLNCAVFEGRVDGDGRLAEVTGYESPTQTFHRVRAGLFVDASGDSVLAAISGARTRVGREAAAEFGEDIAPAAADRSTMGNSCLPQIREYPTPQPYHPPAWARVFRDESEFVGDRGMEGGNWWWIELGGEDDSVHDAAALRQKLLAVVYGVWDYMKNRAPWRGRWTNWALDWVGFLPGKRESARYVGDHILTQNDVRGGGRFHDLVAYGGWSMDDHHPAGFATREPATIHHATPSPYGIPYRSLYSVNVPNLFCAGRNISVTHMALSSTRVMATCALLGQAVGTAAAIAARDGLTPRGVLEKRLDELRANLMDDDVWLPGTARKVAPLCAPGQARYTASSGDAEPLRNGLDRPGDDGADNAWTGAPGRDWAAVEFDAEREIRSVRVVFDSDLNRQLLENGRNRHEALNMPCRFPLNAEARRPPATLVKDFRIETRDAEDRWTTVWRCENNHQRLARLALPTRARAVRIVPESTWGAPNARLFAFEAEDRP